MSKTYHYTYTGNGEADVVEITEDLEGNKVEKSYKAKHDDDTLDPDMKKHLEKHKEKKEK